MVGAPGWYLSRVNPHIPAAVAMETVSFTFGWL